ncbi:MAG: diguanylate cyclase [Leptolyngbyaceae cyanobacterium RU_5_1]|nr:diguanylate cyclase [Leptolyngbyaceae cyanobacterium RU_5_1]
MDASILLVGGDDFLSTLLDRLRNLIHCTVEVASSSSEAVPLIQAQQPDLVILQGNQPGSLELCYELKEQAKLAWIYCMLLDIPTQMLEDAWLESGWEQDSRIEALEGGADAYLRFPKKAERGKELSLEQIEKQDRLLRSQVLAGLRMVKNHRELMRTNDILSAIALSDPLTELNNRRALDWDLPRQIQTARSRAQALSLVMLDVDYFKRINDTYGHPVGDRALQLISSRLRHNLRFHDTLFRYGGEEFVVILSDTDQSEALLVAHRLCRLIDEQPFNIDEGLGLKITISAGTATLEQHDDPRGISLLKRADYNLLQAKSSGRNRVISSLDANQDLDAEQSEDGEEVVGSGE